LKLNVLAPIYASREVSFPHALMFHGFAPGRTTDADPHLIVRNVHSMPELFRPHLGSWTVSDALKERLTPFRGVDFADVEFARIVDVPWQVGEPIPVPAEACEDDGFGGGVVPARFFAALRAASTARRKVGRYFLLVPPAAYVLEAQYPAEAPVQFDFAKSAPSDTFVYPASDGHPISVAMMRDYPVVESEGYLFMTDEVFGVVGPHVDARFFLLGELDLSDRARRRH
jgi:hypothetical protein